MSKKDIYICGDQTTESNNIKAAKQENESDKTLYFTPGYIKVDGIKHMQKADVLKFLEDTANAVAEDIKDNSVKNFNPIINIVTSTKFGVVYGFAYIFLNELSEGHRLYNVLIGKNPDGSEPSVTFDENGVPIRNVYLRFKPLYMNKSQMDAFWESIKVKCANKPDDPEFLAYKNSYDDCSFVRNIRIALKSQDADKISAVIVEYIEIIRDRNDRNLKLDIFVYNSFLDEEGEIREENIELNIGEIVSHIAKSSDKRIMECQLEIEPTYVKDAEPGYSSSHLVTTPIPREFATAEILRPYFSNFCTTEGNFKADYTKFGLKTPIDGPYPHVFIQKTEKGNIGHIFYESSITNYDGRYAHHMRRKVAIEKAVGADKYVSFELVVNFYQESRSQQNIIRPQAFYKTAPLTIPGLNIGAIIASKLKTAGTAARINAAAKNEDEEIVEGGIQTNATKNMFAVLSGQPQSTKPVSVWSKPLPQHVRQGTEATLGLYNLPPTTTGKRKYNPNLRDDGNTKVFY